MVPYALDQIHRARGESSLEPLRDALLQWPMQDLQGIASRGSVAVRAVGHVESAAVREMEDPESVGRYRATFHSGALVSEQGRDVLAEAIGTEFSFVIRALGFSQCATLLSQESDEDKNLLRLHISEEDFAKCLILEWGTERESYKVRVPVDLLEPDSWHDLIMRYTGDRLDFYVDGQLLHHHGTASGKPRPPRGPLVIGGLWNGSEATGCFSGQMEHVAFWDRALSDDEIVALSGGADVVSDRARAIVERRREMENLMAARARGDRLRPAYHFRPRALWMNDPNGMFYWKGEFHLFYQHNPYGPYWGTMHWGHAVSEDLVHWKHLGLALAPTAGGPDRDGCFSGCVIEHEGRPVILYTGVYPECQCIAFGDDDMREFRKFEGNPVIPSPPPSVITRGFRDPWVWKEEDGNYYMVVGSGVEDQGGFLPLYRSSDLLTWEYLHPLFAGQERMHHTVWECPSFFPLGDRWVLLISHEPFGNVQYFVGHYEGHRFHPESRGELDARGNFYAPQVQLDGKGRRILMGWSPEGRGDRSQWRSGWSGVQTLPRELGLGEDRELRIAPIPELQTLRGEGWSFSEMAIHESRREHLPSVMGNMLEIEVELDLGDAREVGLRLLQTPGREEETVLLYDRFENVLMVNRERSSLDNGKHHLHQRAALRLAEGETLNLRIFVDRSMIEVFANGRACLTTRVYPSRSDATGVDLYAAGGTARALSLRAWKMNSIWEDDQ